MKRCTLVVLVLAATILVSQGLPPMAAAQQKAEAAAEDGRTRPTPASEEAPTGMVAHAKAALQELGDKARVASNRLYAEVGGVESLQKKQQELLETIRKNPLDVDAARHLCDLIQAKCDYYLGRLGPIKGLNLPEVQGRLVRDLQSLAQRMAEEANQYRALAKESKRHNRGYASMAESFDNFRDAFLHAADYYKALPITQQLVSMEEDVSFLKSARDSMGKLRDGLDVIKDSKKAIDAIRDLGTQVEDIQQSIKQFSEAVLTPIVAPPSPDLKEVPTPPTGGKA
jgi:hypothetical protein